MQPLLRLKDSKYYILWVCICSLTYSVRNAHVQFCHMWSARRYNIFPHYFINSKILGGKVTAHKVTAHKVTAHKVTAHKVTAHSYCA